MRILRDPQGKFERGSLRHDLAVLDRYWIDENDCWLWLGNINKGYGRCKWNGKNVGAHRVFYEVHKGPIPTGADIDHLCRVPSCVNPDHLEAVSRAENTRRGAGTKLTPRDVIEIRLEIDRLCEKHGIRPRTLAAIGERKIWKGV